MLTERLASAIQSSADFLFVPVLVIVLFGTGIFLTLRFGFVQVRRFPDAMRAFFGRPESGAVGALSPFQAFMTALAATIGTGNIAGVAAAIVSGGPGALFWIWAYGFVATAIKFGEAVLGVTFGDSSPRRRAVRPDVLPARRPAFACAGHDLRGRCRHRCADDDAVHADELDRSRHEHAASAFRCGSPVWSSPC